MGARRKAKAPPPPVPPPNNPIAPPVTPNPNPSELYDDVANFGRKKSSSSSSSSNNSSSRSSSEDVVQLRHKQVDQDRRGSSANMLIDKDEARKSFQAAPEKYRKESSYLDVDGINSA